MNTMVKIFLKHDNSMRTTIGISAHRAYWCKQKRGAELEKGITKEGTSEWERSEEECWICRECCVSNDGLGEKREGRER